MHLREISHIWTAFQFTVELIHVLDREAQSGARAGVPIGLDLSVIYHSELVVI